MELCFFQSMPFLPLAQPPNGSNCKTLSYRLTRQTFLSLTKFAVNLGEMIGKLWSLERKLVQHPPKNKSHCEFNHLCQIHLQRFHAVCREGRGDNCQFLPKVKVFKLWTKQSSWWIQLKTKEHLSQTKLSMYSFHLLNNIE